MAQAEGPTLEFVGPEFIDPKRIESFPYQGPRQRVTYTTTKFSAVCPFSGLPDLGTVVLEYYPRQKCAELKSLKYYYLSYRNVGIYQEDATARLYQDIWRALEPFELTVTVTYQTRGGIDTVTRICSTEQSSGRSADQATR